MTTQEDTEKIPKVEGSKGCSWQIPVRYVIGLLIFTGCTVQYMANVCLSVAIVAMVKPSQSTVAARNSTTEDDNVCPEIYQKYINSNQDGEFFWDEKTQGQILAAYYYGYVATQLIGGRLSEVFGPRMVCGPGILIAGLLTVLCPLAARFDYRALIWLRIFIGAASGTALPSFHVLFANWFLPDERLKISGLVFSGTNVGSLLSLSLSGVLAQLGGWPLVFYFFGAISIIWWVPWTILAYSSPQEHPRISQEEKNYIISNNGTTKHEVGAPVPWGKILTSGQVWAAIFMASGMTWITFTFLTELPTYCKNILHFNISESGVISALPYLFTWMTSVLSGYLSQSLRARGLLTHIGAYRIFNGIAAIGSAICLSLISYISCNVNIIVCLLITTMAARGTYFGGSYINHVDLASNYAGTIGGLLLTIANTAGIFSPLLTGFLTQGQQTLQQWRYVFYVSIAAILIPYIIFLLFGSTEEQTWNKPKETINKQEHINESSTTTHM